MKAQKLEEDAKAIDEIRQAVIDIHNRNRVVKPFMPVADPACKPTVTLSSPSLFFQPSKPSSFSDWSSLECVVALERLGFHIHKLERRAPYFVPALNLETLKPKVFVWRKCNVLSRQYLLALVAAVVEATWFHRMVHEHGLVHGKPEVYYAHLLLGVSPAEAKSKSYNVQVRMDEDTGQQIVVRTRGAGCGTLDEDFENGNQPQKNNRKGRGVKQKQGRPKAKAKIK